MNLLERRHFVLSHCWGLPKMLLWKVRTVKTLVFWALAVGEAPGKTVEPVLCPEGNVLLPSATCHTFLVSWHLCAQHAIQMSARGLFSCGRNVLRMQTACQAAFFILVLNLFVKHCHPSPLPRKEICLVAYAGGGEVQHSGGWCRLPAQ